ncbi:hypothetical protein SUGI_0473350 [Cryptomeria japonica]|nr:hypothetical protein SUGI_0473350 [Cryptomeria japonica]
MDEGPQQSDLYHHFIDLLNGMFQIPLNFPGTLYRRARIESTHIRGILQSVIEKKRKDLASGSASPQQDLLSFLLCNADGSGNALSDDEIKDNIMLLLMAGHDTSVVTVTLLEVSGSESGLLPKGFSRANGDKAGGGDKGGGTWRKAIVDIFYAGFTIPRGWKLFWTSSTHKNAEYFKDSEKFDPSRFEGNGSMPYTFVPFGGGPQMSSNHEFARMVILVFIHNIVKNVEWELVNVNERVIIDQMPAPEDGLPINLRHHTISI